jgi:hypothetical protein
LLRIFRKLGAGFAFRSAFGALGVGDIIDGIFG